MGPIAETTTGRVEGREKDGVLLFAGIPYAAPRTASDRFTPPQPHPGWAEVRDATRFGPVAMQSAGTVEALAGGGAPDWDEDCLFLNVQTPSLDGERRPVLVWIHGGGFTSGAGSIPWYDGARLVANGDVVVVTLNYRLGAPGWLYVAHLDPELAASGNSGLLDQIAALRWVRDNIAAFGGDPGNVTLFGESAGGMSIATLMGTPAATGLFHKAVPQSGAAHNTVSVDAAVEVTEHLCRALDVATVEELRAVPADRLLEVQSAVATDLTRTRASRPDAAGLGLPFGPVVDGVVLPRPPLDAIRGGSAAGVALLTGTTAEEWRLFGIMLRAPEDEDAIVRRIGRLIENPHELVAAYRQSRDDASHDDLWTAILTDRVFRIPAIRLAEAQLPHAPAAVFMYLFEWASTAFGGRLGSCHALEIPFVFDNLHKGGVDLFTGPNPPRALADAMHRSWLAFARSGHPGHDGVPGWPVYDVEGRATMHFGDAVRLEHDPAAEVRAAWDGVL
ncbi:MAG: carboxylesterase/lipase family protein [Acidimicrobiales bacterium]|jgi:para-nitrobenzyl esterase|nr:carboxylesterase/lipase family protein [Acidimicrobiales bacterium]